MNIHLHGGPLDALKYDEPFDLVVDEVVIPPAMPNKVGSGCYRIFEVFVEGAGEPPRACARWGD